MAREYFCAYHSYLQSMRKLSDAECGRLFRALLQYSMSGELINLQGREEIVFDIFSQQIDRDREAYERKCQTNKDNRSSTVVNGRQRSSTVVDEIPRNAQDKEEDKDKDKDKEEYITHSYATATNNARAREASQAPKMSGSPLIQQMIKLGIIREAVEVAEKNAQIAPPSYDDVREYAFSNHLEELVDAEDFVNHYRSTGWMAGKTPVTDWTAQVDKWAARARKEEYGY